MDDFLKLKKLLKDKFEMKDLSLTKRLLGMDINRDKIKGFF